MPSPCGCSVPPDMVRSVGLSGSLGASPAGVSFSVVSEVVPELSGVSSTGFATSVVLCAGEEESLGSRVVVHLSHHPTSV